MKRAAEQPSHASSAPAVWTRTFAGRRRWLLDALSIGAAVVVGVWLATTVVSRTVEIGPLDLKVSLSAGLPGRTTFEIPPFGTVGFRSHTGPARVSVAVDAIDVAAAQELLAGGAGVAAAVGAAARAESGSDGASGAQAAVSDVIGAEFSRTIREFVWLAVTVGVVGALISGAVLIAMRRSARVVLAGAAAALALILGSAGVGATTFDPGSFNSPKLTGALAYVPELQSVFTTRLSSIRQLRVQAATAANNIAAYYADPRSINAGGGLTDTYRVLHVTDQHLDPVGAEFARGLARSYEASLVIDTGDIAIGGTVEELALMPSLVITSTPVVYIPGNHDSPVTTRYLQQSAGYSVITSGTVTVDGLTIMPIPDPESASASIEPNGDRVEAAAQEALARLDSREAAGLAPPEIVALHNPAFEKLLLDRTPLLLSGHTHSPRLYRHATTVRLNSGTTGGMPYDPIVSGRDRLPHSASVLYYTRTLPRRLIAIDAIRVGVDGTTSLDRTVIDETLLP